MNRKSSKELNSNISEVNLSITGSNNIQSNHSIIKYFKRLLLHLKLHKK